MPAIHSSFRPVSPAPLLRSLTLVAVLAAVLIAPGPAVADLDAVFVLDTTGSMGGEIREVQERVRELAVSLSQARDGERIRFGIVAFRDRGDDYVTKLSPLTEDIEASQSFLSALVANGGGDGPESVVAAIEAALKEMSWDPADSTDRQIFLVGDAPPHLDYGDEPTPEDLVEVARRGRIVVNTIGCRSLPGSGVEFFRRLAYATEGSYQHIGRVRSAGSGGLTEAMSRAAAPGREAGTGGGTEIPLVWTGREDGGASGILVRQRRPAGSQQDLQGDPRAPCSLEVRLPAGFALAGDPLARLGNGGLRVEIDLEIDPTEGPGGTELFALETCPPLSTPVHVVLGGL